MTDETGMRYGTSVGRIDGVALLLVHLIATAALAGLVWVVQLVVYPSFRIVGPTAAWPAVHAAHGRAISIAVGVPWAVQGLAVAALLVREGQTPLLVLTGLLALVTVLVTVTVSVPLHELLGRGYDDAVARRLVRTNWLRTAAWTAGTVCACGVGEPAAARDWRTARSAAERTPRHPPGRCDVQVPDRGLKTADSRRLCTAAAAARRDRTGGLAR